MKRTFPLFALATSVKTSIGEHTMVFKAGVPQGAALDPCMQLLACKPEPAAPFRPVEIAYWKSAFTTSSTPTSCSTPSVGYSHIAPMQFGDTCATTGCCPSTRRSLLFGMSGTPTGGPSTSSCDTYC